MINQNTWIVVANSATAKVYRLVKFPKIEELTSMEHPESRLHSKDLISMKPGKTNTAGARSSSYQPPSDPKELEIEKFAKEVSQYLNSAHHKGEFSRLYILASPSFLGLLRQNLNAKTQQSIVSEAAKDLVDYTKADVEQHLAKLKI